MEINERLIKVSMSKMAVDFVQEPQLGDDVQITIKGSIVKTEDGDNQNGTKDRTYVVKGVIARLDK